jgi:hydroxymethylglutaryl-CoA synthase
LVGIVSWGSYIPRYRIKVEEIAKAQGADAIVIKESLMITEKSFPDIDEDTATMAVEAGRIALGSSALSPDEISAIYIGSESHPYAVKPTGTIVAQALGMGNGYTCADLQFACKGGTAALQIAYHMARNGLNVVAGAADTAQSAPGDILEYTAAAGAAMFLVGKENVCAEIKDTVSFSSDTPDFWRRPQKKYPSHAGSFTGEPSYFRHVMSAAKILMKKNGTVPKDYDYAIFHQPNGKFPSRVAKKLGFTQKQISDGMLVAKIGNTYSAASLLGLCAVLDIAKPGQRILLTSYGSGAGSDSFDILITENIIEAQKNRKTTHSFIEDKVYGDYLKYLKRAVR